MPAAMSPLEKLIGERMKVRVARAPSLLMTSFVGGAIGAAIGLATGAEGRGSALRYGALGAALGLAGSFAYGIYNTRSATEQALAEEHQSLLAAGRPSAPAHAPRPPPVNVPFRAGYGPNFPWE